MMVAYFFRLSLVDSSSKSTFFPLVLPQGQERYVYIIDTANQATLKNYVNDFQSIHLMCLLKARGVELLIVQNVVSVVG